MDDVIFVHKSARLRTFVHEFQRMERNHVFLSSADLHRVSRPSCSLSFSTPLFKVLSEVVIAAHLT